MAGKSGQAALVTGAAVRLGRAVALALAEAGYDLVIHYNRSAGPARQLCGEIERLGRRATALRANLENGRETIRLARAAEKAFGRIDLLVNSAAIFRPTPLEKLTEKELDRFLAVNLKAPYLLGTEIGRRMKKRGRGAIVNLACVSAFRPWRDFLPYSISKAGVVALTVGLAKALAPQVRVNAIAPGTVLPPSGMSRAEIDLCARRVLLKKIGSPDDIVAAVLYLARAEFVTGQVLVVDGGRSVV